MSVGLWLRQRLVGRVWWKILFGWIAIVFFGFYFTAPARNTASLSLTSSFHLQNELSSLHAKQYLPQAIVFIAMGSMAKEALVEDSISSVRLLGRWSEEIVILTDRPACFDELVSTSGGKTTTTYVPPKNTLMEIKTMKAEIFQYLPTHLERVLYMDVDILVTGSMNFFLFDFAKVLLSHVTSKPNEQLLSSNSTTNSTSNSNSMVTNIDYAAFLDSGGHYVGFCSGCEKWHTGVMYLQRHKGQECLKKWAEILSSGKYGTDQESLDYAEKLGYCPNTVQIPSRHLLFAKDYLAAVLTAGQTFVHLTAVNREEGDYLYRNIVVPHYRNALHPPLRAYQPDRPPKSC